MPRNLTLKQQRFITEYIKSGNATEAASRAGYSNNSRVTLATQAYENIRKPKIQQAIRQQLIKHELTPEWVLSQIRGIAVEAEKDNDKLKALELIGKHLRLFGDIGNTFTGDITISFGQPLNPSARLEHNPNTMIEGQAQEV